MNKVSWTPQSRSQEYGDRKNQSKHRGNIANYSHHDNIVNMVLNATRCFTADNFFEALVVVRERPYWLTCIRVQETRLVGIT